MHYCKKHLKRGIQKNGCPAVGDDMVFETKHRHNKRLKLLVYQTGTGKKAKRVVMQTRVRQIVRAAGGVRKKRRTGEYDARKRSKVNNEGEAVQVGHLLKMAEHYESLQPPPKKSKRVVRVEGVKQEDARAQRCKSLEALERELESLTEKGEN